MKWILLIFLMNGDDGGNVSWTQVAFQNRELCEIAKNQYLNEHSKISLPNSYRVSKAFCFQVSK
jgi:hypothetical protein